jgi:hypothetical protein
LILLLMLRFSKTYPGRVTRTEPAPAATTTTAARHGA